MQLKKYNEFTHFCYFDRTSQQQPPFTQVLTVHHYTSLELLHKNNQSNLATLNKGLKMLFLHKHTDRQTDRQTETHTNIRVHTHKHTCMHAHTHTQKTSLYCKIMLQFIPIKTQNDSRLNSVISSPEVEHIKVSHIQSLSSSRCTTFNVLKRQNVKFSMYRP